MNAWEFRYPEFKEGQVLSHNDLNLLRDFLYTRTALHGRALFGFGVACGLEGTIAGGNVQLSPGIALGQGGRELLLETQRTISIASVTGGGFVTYAGVGGSDGYTPILRAADVEVPAGGDCDEDGCTTHTELHTLTAEIVWARGRLTRTGAGTDAIFTREPIAAPYTQAKFEALKGHLVAYLTGKLEPETIALLTALAYGTGSSAQVQALNLMRIGVLNEILYTLWAHRRCVDYLGLGCLGVAAADPAQPGLPGVALGWLHQAGSTWTWERRDRHEFQLSRALYMAMEARGPGDPCQRYLDHVRVLLQTYEEPAPTPTDPVDPPTGGDVDICPPILWKYGYCGPWWNGDLREELPEDLFQIDPSKVRFPPPRPGPDDYRVAYVDEVLKNDVLGIGLVRTTEFLFTNGTKAKTSLEQAIRRQTTAEPNVTVLPVGELAGKSGFRAGLVASAGDEIVFGVDARDRIVTVGSVPAQHSLSDVAAVPGLAREATAQAALAVEAMERLEPIALLARDRVLEFEEDFASIRTEWADVKGMLPREQELVRMGRLTAELDQVRQHSKTLEKGLVTLEKRLDTQVRKLEATATTKVERLRGQITTSKTELLGMVRENRHRVERQRIVVDQLDKETDRVRAQLSDLQETTQEQLAAFGGRMDTQALAVRTGMTTGDIARVQATNASLVKAIDQLADAVGATTAPTRSRTQVNKLLAGAREQVEVLKRGATSPLTLTESQPEGVVMALQGIVSAMEKSGAPTAQTQAAKAAVQNLARQLELG